MSKSSVRIDCAHFNGYKPCRPHKVAGHHCEGCPEFTPQGPNILVIKLRAAGEVVRNTPLISKLKKEYPGCRIYWLTAYPELISKKDVHRVLPWSFESTLVLEDLEFELLLSLDKDLEACALANRVRARTKKGFSQWNGGITAFDQDAHPKWERGVFDDLMKANTQHYIAETFAVCGWEFQEEEYLLPSYRAPQVELSSDPKKKKIALNTGAGDAWKPRKYSESRWIELAKILIASGNEVYLVGGPAEEPTNRAIAKASGAKYFGTYGMTDFIGLLSLADAVVTSVSFAFHLAVGLKKPMVLLNNTFNPHEFYMYGRGVVLQPELDCLMCYKNDFDDQCVTRDCMDLIRPDQIQAALQKLI